MILITGANGQTGHAIIKKLLSKRKRIRALVHKPEQISEMKLLGDIDVIVGNMMDQNAINAAFSGVTTAYHICSALNPNEVEIGKIAINAAKTSKIEQFIYHSVLHSVLQDMPHHQKKLMVEELLVNSGLPYTIIQPAVFMQNILESWASLVELSVFRQKFFTTSETRMCMLDLTDLAEAISIIISDKSYIGATYELCGPENLSLSEMVATLEKHFGREIKVETPPDDLMAKQLRNHGADDYRVDTLLKMFRHYNEHGFVGNPNVLTWILERKPIDFSTFVLRTIREK